MFSVHGLRILVLSFVVLLGVTPGVAASFGKNKVQYQKSDWKKIQTPHFDIYFTQDMLPLAEHSADQIELMYENLSRVLQHKLSTRIPIILHRSHAHFVETNVIRMALPEAVGGFTEVFKNRIVLPFMGSWNEFDHVLKHELLHAMMFDQFSGTGRGMSLAKRMSSMPLWFKEGLAEYASLGWDLESEFYLLDAVTTGYVASPKYNFGGFLAYKGGQSFLYYLVSQFGEDALAQLIKELVKGYPFEAAFLKTYKVSLEETGELWIRELRRIYWPELGKRNYPKSFAKALTSHEKDESHFNLSPAISPDGTKMVYFSDLDDWEGLHLMDLTTGKNLGRILKSGSRSEHESLHPFNSGFSWAPNNQDIAFVSKQKGRDVIHIFNTSTRTIVEVLDPELDMILNPAFNPQNPDEIVFSGATQTQEDLYIFNRQTLALTKLTQDVATQASPQFSPDGTQIVFASNQGQGEKIAQDELYLYLYDRTKNQLRKLESQPGHSPIWIDSNNIAFVSNRSGVSNIYNLNLTTNQSLALTNTLSATFTPSYSQAKDQMVFALFERGGWDIYNLEEPLSQAIPTPLPLTHFKQIQQSSQRQESFFEKIQLQNLTSYKKDTTVVLDTLTSTDSLKSALDSLEISKQKNGNSKEASKQDQTKRRDIVNIESSDDYFQNEKFSQKSAAANFSQDTTVDSDSTLYDAPKPLPDSIGQQIISSSKLPNGDYVVRDYEPIWSLDQAQAMAGAATNGSNVNVGGQAFLTFSDLMGDQEIDLMLYSAGIRGDIEDMNFATSYHYLPERIDYSVGFSRYVEYPLDSSQTRVIDQKMIYGDPYADSVVLDSVLVLKQTGPLPEDTTTITQAVCAYHTKDKIDYVISYQEKSGQGYCSRFDRFRDVNLGFNLNTQYPFSVFSRVGLTLNYNWIQRTRTIIDGNIIYPENRAPTQNLYQLNPQVHYAFDNIRWGITGPINGNRSFLSLDYFPQFENQAPDYFVAQADVRNYFRFFKNYTLALRVSGGSAFGSFGANSENVPYRFLVGGDDFTLNYHLNRSNLTGRLVDRYQATLDTPLRGFDYLDFAGRNKFVTNLDWRFPFIEKLYFRWPFPIPIHDVQGVLLADYGGAWNTGNPMDQMGLGLGYGLRMNIGYFVLRYTKAWSIDDIGPRKHDARSYWSLGAEF